MRLWWTSKMWNNISWKRLDSFLWHTESRHCLLKQAWKRTGECFFVSFSLLSTQISITVSKWCKPVSIWKKENGRFLWQILLNMRVFGVDIRNYASSRKLNKHCFERSKQSEEELRNLTKLIKEHNFTKWSSHLFSIFPFFSTKRSLSADTHVGTKWTIMSKKPLMTHNKGQNCLPLNHEWKVNLHHRYVCVRVCFLKHPYRHRLWIKTCATSIEVSVTPTPDVFAYDQSNITMSGKCLVWVALNLNKLFYLKYIQNVHIIDIKYDIQ